MHENLQESHGSERPVNTSLEQLLFDPNAFDGVNLSVWASKNKKLIFYIGDCGAKDFTQPIILMMTDKNRPCLIGKPSGAVEENSVFASSLSHPDALGQLDNPAQIIKLLKNGALMSNGFLQYVQKQIWNVTVYLDQYEAKQRREYQQCRRIAEYRKLLIKLLRTSQPNVENID